MFFLVFSFRYALAVGLTLLYSLANATLDNSCRGEADQKRFAAPDSCLARRGATAVNTSTVINDYYSHCLCGNTKWFDNYSDCLNRRTTNTQWISEDKRRRCRDCNNYMHEDRIDTVVPRVVITFIHQASHLRKPSFLLDSSLPFICAFSLNLAIIQVTVSSSSLRQAPPSGSLRQVPALPRSQARQVSSSFGHGLFLCYMFTLIKVHTQSTHLASAFHVPAHFQPVHFRSFLSTLFPHFEKRA
ncbi:BZ3500_MvSof-1268-A1-R1_Chr7-3g09681 [Microbotryum saponariae]|uniref:BZ3500_MvSof-1268-A1-R1_Chr7-3g09681 protein n=1 Tax=Microbotryum saponariae TaxID=289078 RepID=A0A2X0MYV0_9BASI|nr:BZ3501_MvSof-1269-A2-R1_Chr7-2g09404 [Microbotryum saponariae]SDA02404.1 BZ3500_MvSof-1268-A1-R1_Chr7-3g09681 [Microbotryum saponariae]